MGASRPKPPATRAPQPLPRTGLEQVDKVIDVLEERLRLLESAPQPMIVDGRRAFELGGDQGGDIYYRTRDGKIARLAPGTPGQVLEMGADGLPRWV